MGNIYKGRVANVLPACRLRSWTSAWSATLSSTRAISWRTPRLRVRAEDDINLRPKKIEEMVKEGQEIVVQVLKQPGGQKGARITTHVTLPGRMLVLMPTVNHVGVSRRIEDEQERSRLKEIMEQIKPRTWASLCGLRLWARRRKICGRGDFLERVGRILQRSEVLRARAACRGSLIFRTVRDICSPRVSEFLSTTRVLRQGGRGGKHHRAGLKDRVRLYEGGPNIFDDFGIRRASTRRWTKKCG